MGGEADGADNEMTAILNLLAGTNLSICGFLQSIDQRLLGTEAAIESLSASALNNHLDIGDSFAKLTNYDDDTLSSLFAPMLEMAPAMAKNHDILLEHLKLFHETTMNQFDTQEAALDSIYTAQIDRWDEFSEELKVLQSTQVGEHEKIDKKLEAHREVQEEEHNTVIEKLDQVLDEQKGLKKLLLGELQKVQNGQKVIHKEWMENMIHVFNAQPLTLPLAVCHILTSPTSPPFSWHRQFEGHLLLTRSLNHSTHHANKNKASITESPSEATKQISIAPTMPSPVTAPSPQQRNRTRAQRLYIPLLYFLLLALLFVHIKSAIRCENRVMDVWENVGHMRRAFIKEKESNAQCRLERYIYYFSQTGCRAREGRQRS